MRRVAADGFPLAATWLLDQIVEKPLADGQHFIPREGPVVIASNHPGAFDGLVILSNLPRLDIQMIISDVPFTRHLVGTRPHLIFSAGNNPSERMAAARALRPPPAQWWFVIALPHRCGRSRPFIHARG